MTGRGFALVDAPLLSDWGLLPPLRGRGDDLPALVTYFKKRTVSEETRAKIAGLIARLGADEYDVREKATAELTDLGGLGRALLAQALKDPEAAVRREAIVALMKYGPDASQANATLAEMKQHDRDGVVRSHAARALEKLSGAQ